jgi:hypothetical protein
MATPQSYNDANTTAGTPPLNGKDSTSTNGFSEAVGSPFKKQRPSLPGMDGAVLGLIDDAAASNNVAPQQQTTSAAEAPGKAMMDEDEEL